ncbi:MAG TPA: hypothetical protein VME43_31425 [Bryobacteraceae bacterium]|nr:hypothetical protein [Bryobacteraceae bacterium]
MRKLCSLLPWLMAALLWGQDQTPGQGTAAAAKTPSSQAQPGSQSANRTIDTAKTHKPKPTNSSGNNRLFYTLPNFLTVEDAANAPPLTVGEKFKLTSRDAFDPVQFAWYGMQAAIAQAENDEPGYGQGAKGYAERYAERFADGTIENFMTHPIFGSILHQDPRYFQLGQGGFWHRAVYAFSRVLITRSDSGTTQFNASEVFGAAVGAGISTYTYHPRNDRKISDAVDVWGTQVGYDALSNIAKEFWPDIQRKIHAWRTGNAGKAQ